jgi:glutathione S-transferase
MDIKVHGVALSPFVRKVRVVLLEKHLPYELVVTSFPLPADFTRLNPLKRIPVMEHDGHILADSAVIAHYLERQFPTDKLIPTDPWLAARCEWFEKYADYELRIALEAIFHQRVVNLLFGKPCKEEAVAAAIEAAKGNFDYLEAELGSNSFFAGNSFSLADIALACMIINMEHGGEKLDRKRWPGLFSWYERVLSRPGFVNVLPEERAFVQSLRAT